MSKWQARDFGVQLVLDRGNTVKYWSEHMKEISYVTAAM